MNIAGCPPIGDVVTATIVHYLTFGRLPDARRRGPAAVRLRRADPRPVPPAGQLRRRPVRRGVRRRGGPQGLVPLQGGLQGAGDLLALPDLPVEHPDQLADRRRASVHRLHRAELLGHDDAVLRPAARRRRVRRRAAGRSARRGAGGRAPRPAWPRTPSRPASTRSASGAARELPVLGPGDRRRPRADREEEPPWLRPGSSSIRSPGSRGTSGSRRRRRTVGSPTPGRRSTQFRGIEIIMQGRDPRDAWAFTQRICGVCTVVHAVASCRAVEDALDITIPPNANLDPEPDPRHAVHPGPRDPLLPPARARLGGRGERAQGRSRRHRGDRAEGLALAQQLGDLLPRGAGPAQEVRRRRPARNLHQRLLGTPGLQASARGEPARGGALPRGARLAAGRHPAAHDLRRQEPAPELPRRRDGLAPSTSTTPRRSTPSG